MALIKANSEPPLYLVVVLASIKTLNRNWNRVFLVLLK